MEQAVIPDKHTSPSFRADPVMSIGSGLIIILFVLYTVLFPENAKNTFSEIKNYVAANLAWYYVGLMSAALFFSIYLVFSRYGGIRLGKDNEKPQFSFFSWFSMLFGAGVGIGILFWSIAEPIYHLQSNPFTSPENAMTAGAGQIAMRISLFHWGLHGWGLFALCGLSLAYFSYRKGLPLSVRSGLYPLLGDRIYGPIGHAADLLAVFGTVFGIATSLGLGAQQMNAGINYLFDIEISTTTQIIIIAVISILATISVITGVDKGIRILSELNMQLTVVMLAFFIILGPTAYLLGSFFTNVGDYALNFATLGMWVDTDPSKSWQGDWTIFYWGWWISWAPFCGVFIARISRGRTIREFILGVLLAPTLLAAFWITIFGNTAIHIELFGSGGVVEAVNKDLTLALFTTIELMDVGTVLTLAGATICTVMLVTYFITSADSATLVICNLVSMGDPSPPTRYRIFWGAAIGSVAAVLLFSGGLKALQTASVLAALPFSLVVMATAFGLYRALRAEPLPGNPSLFGEKT